MLVTYAWLQRFPVLVLSAISTAVSPSWLSRALFPEAASLGHPKSYHIFFRSPREHCPQLPTILYHERHPLTYFVHIFVVLGSRDKYAHC